MYVYKQKSAFSRIIFLTVTLCLMQSFVIYRSINNGTMSGVIQWDDCAFLVRGIRNLHWITNSKTIAEAAKDIVTMQLHAPLADLQVLAGLLLTGGQVWGPFSLNLLLVLLCLSIINAREIQSSRVLFLALAVFMISQPITIHALTFLKPDWKAGLLVGSAILALKEGAEQHSLKLKILGSVLLSAAVTLKMTAFYLPLFSIGLVAAFEIYGAFLKYPSYEILDDKNGAQLVKYITANLRNKWRFWSVLSAIILIPWAVLFLQGFDHYISYIKGALNPYWHDNLSIPERLIFYSPWSEDGKNAWGFLLHSFLFFFVAWLFFVPWKGEPVKLIPIILIICAALLLLLPLAIAPTSNLTFGATMMGVVLGGSLVMIRDISRSSPRVGSRVTLVAVVIFMLLSPIPLSNSSYKSFGSDVPDISNAEQRQLKNIYSSIAGEMRGSSEGVLTALVLYDHMYAPYRALTISYFEETGQLLRARYLRDAITRDGLKSRLSGVQYVVSLSADKPTLDQSRLFSITAGADLAIAGIDQLKLVKVWKSGNNEFRLYKNILY